ncbi:MAG: KUP/HAK/KT family potassium transporter [Bacteroidales bacterium]
MLPIIQHNKKLNKLRLAGLIVTIGSVYGDIGTSPLYVLKAVFGNLGFYNANIVSGVAPPCRVSEAEALALRRVPFCV